MLTPKETKLVVGTLATRKAWLRKMLDSNELDPTARTEHMSSLHTLDSAIQKLAHGTNTKAKITPTAPSQPIPSRLKNLSMETARVLIAEDNKDSAKLLAEILADMGMRYIDIAEDGMIAFDKIKRAKEDPYNVILCDWDMPELSGLEVHEKAKASNTLKGAHFIMVTAVSEASRIREAITQGVNDYIVKPIDMDILEGKLKAAIENMAAK